MLSVATAGLPPPDSGVGVDFGGQGCRLPDLAWVKGVLGVAFMNGWPEWLDDALVVFSRLWG